MTPATPQPGRAPVTRYPGTCRIEHLKPGQFDVLDPDLTVWSPEGRSDAPEFTWAHSLPAHGTHKRPEGIEHPYFVRLDINDPHPDPARPPRSSLLRRMPQVPSPSWLPMRSASTRRHRCSGFRSHTPFAGFVTSTDPSGNVSKEIAGGPVAGEPSPHATAAAMTVENTGPARHLLALALAQVALPNPAVAGRKQPDTPRSSMVRHLSCLLSTEVLLNQFDEFICGRPEPVSVAGNPTTIVHAARASMTLALGQDGLQRWTLVRTPGPQPATLGRIHRIDRWILSSSRLAGDDHGACQRGKDSQPGCRNEPSPVTAQHRLLHRYLPFVWVTPHGAGSFRGTPRDGQADPQPALLQMDCHEHRDPFHVRQGSRSLRAKPGPETQAIPAAPPSGARPQPGGSWRRSARPRPPSG